MNKQLKIMLTVSMLAGFLGGCVTGTKMGAPTTGMSSDEYQSLLRLDPQNTLGSNWDAVRDTPGYFLIDNQGEPTVSVVDYHKGETIKKIQMGETGNHHIFVIPGARYAFSSQRYEKDLIWVIDLISHEVVDTFHLSMGGKKVIAPLHMGFAYTQPLAVVGNILDKKNGYLSFINTATRKPSHIVELGCPGARDAMFTLDDSKVFATCQQEPKGVSIVDVKSRKEVKVIPIKGGRTGGMTPDGKYFMVGASKAIVFIDTATNEITKTIKVPGGGGNFTCLPDGSKCYGGLRKDNSVAVSYTHLTLPTTPYV